jgi:outer membrane protein OmpA-like peptidoglycan-associated protein
MDRKRMFKWTVVLALVMFLPTTTSFAAWMDKQSREEKRKKELEDMQKQFDWWPSDAKPAPVKDEKNGGYWWWPAEPGQVRPWGNRGYVYVYKIIFDYKAEELPPPQPKELRPSLLIKKIIRNVKVYFDYNKSDLREDATKILEKAVFTLSRNPDASILITGNADIRGSENYNEKLGKARGESVKKYMLDHNIAENRIKIISRGKLDATAPVTDLVGMQKDRNAQFMIAEVEEVNLPYEGPPQDIPKENVKVIDEGKYEVQQQEKVESEVKVSTKEYIIQKNDSLWKIAQKELGNGNRWKYLYELNKNVIKNPNKLKAGTKIIIPVE